VGRRRRTLKEIKETRHKNDENVTRECKMYYNKK
jgi:hypothetical protein